MWSASFSSPDLFQGLRVTYIDHEDEQYGIYYKYLKALDGSVERVEAELFTCLYNKMTLMICYDLTHTTTLSLRYHCHYHTLSLHYYFHYNHPPAL